MTRRQAGGLALFGGAFNPPHRTHDKIIRAALTQLPINALVVVPAGGHPFKQDGQLAAADHRLAMARIAFCDRLDLPGVTVSDFETAQSGLTYTVDTLAAFKNRDPDRPLFFLLGSDNLHDLHKWRRIHAILQMAKLVVYPRLGFPCTLSALAGLDLPTIEKQELLQSKIMLDQPDDTSATAIRAELAAHGSPPMLDQNVLEYVRRHGLYEAR